jgi:hypothetical protein
MGHPMKGVCGEIDHIFCDLSRWRENTLNLMLEYNINRIKRFNL